MAVEQTYNPVRQSGNGVTTRFSFGFTIYRQEDLVVQIINKTTSVATTKTLATHYTVTISATEEGGYIDFIGGVVPASTEWVFLYSDIAYTQPTSFPIGEGIREESVERMADRTVRLVQQVKAGIDRAVQLPPSADAGQIYLPNPDGTKILGWNGSGQLENKTELDTDAQAAAEAAAAIAVAAAEDAVEAKEAAETIAGWEVADQTTAEAGLDNTKVMTPLRVKDSIAVGVKLNEVTAPTTAANQGAVYAKNDGTETALYFREESDGDEIQVTKGGRVNVTINTGSINHGATIPLPSGFTADQCTWFVSANRRKAFNSVGGANQWAEGRQDSYCSVDENRVVTAYTAYSGTGTPDTENGTANYIIIGSR